MRLISVHDTTLRDGEQAPGNSMTVEQKLQIARGLENMKVNIIEAGFPAASPADFQAVQEISRQVNNAQVAAFARCKLEDIDAAINALKLARNPQIEIVVTTSDFHLKARNLTYRSNLKQIQKAIQFARHSVEDIKLILEDASRAKLDYVKAVIRVAAEEGASRCILADTVGIAFPSRIESLVRSLKAEFPDVSLGIHSHNDLGLATANSLAAIKAGVDEVQGTLCGIGERAGNAALEEIIAVLHYHPEYYRCTTSVDLQQIYSLSRQLLAFINNPSLRTKAIIGENAFATEAGMHQSAILKDPSTYEAVKPEDFGRTRSLVLGRHSGRSIIRNRLIALGYEADEGVIDRLYSELVLGQIPIDETELNQHFRALLATV